MVSQEAATCGCLYSSIKTEKMETSVPGSPWLHFKGSRATSGQRRLSDSKDILPALPEVLLDGAAVARSATGRPRAGPSLGVVGAPSGSSVSLSPSLAYKRGSKLAAWIGDI